MAAAVLSRRHAVGADTARGLLFTVLGEFVLPAGGAAWTGTLIDVLRRVGVEEKATRQALMRTAGDGWLASERIGRRTRWQLTTAGRQLLTDGAERIYAFGSRPDWDGQWLLVLARTPDAGRSARHILRSRLTWAGFGSPAPGVWVSTHAERLAEVESVLGQAGLSADAHVFTGTHTGGGDLTGLVGQAFDLDAIARQYDEFIAEFGGSEPAGDPLARVVELVHAWRRFPFLDPDLPAALLPSGWSGSVAAAVFRRRHAAWAPAARADWRQLCADQA